MSHPNRSNRLSHVISIPPGTVPVIGITGGSGSGKTAITQALCQCLPDSVTVLPLDGYYRDLSYLPPDARTRINFDHPDALETETYLLHLRNLASGLPVQSPVYDFCTHTRTRTQTVNPADWIVAEGSLLFSVPALETVLNLSVYLDVPDDIRLLRRIQRDLDERGRTLNSVTRQYLETVRPMYERYIAPSKTKADMVLDGTRPIDDLAKELAGLIFSRICR